MRNINGGSISSGIVKKSQNQNRYFFICTGKDCLKKGAKELHSRLEKELASTNGPFNTAVIKTRCIDHCKRGPLLVLDNICYEKVNPKNLMKILKK